jgi:hypothetical protein
MNVLENGNGIKTHRKNGNQKSTPLFRREVKPRIEHDFSFLEKIFSDSVVFWAKLGGPWAG